MKKETQEERLERFWKNSIPPERRKRIEVLKKRGTVRYDVRIDQDKDKGAGR